MRSERRAESSQHSELVSRLADFLAAVGLVVTHRDCAGYSRPPLFSAHRPDVLAAHFVVRTRVLGEAKRGPDLLERRSLAQLRAFGSALIPSSPPTPAHVVLAVPINFV